MSRVSDKNKENAAEDSDSDVTELSDGEDEDDEADAGHDETTDLYRNSSLGM